MRRISTLPLNLTDMKSILFFTLLASLLITSCTPSGEKTNQDTQSEVIQEGTSDAAPAPTELGLNNGEKWPVNPEMMVHVAVSDSLLQNFEAGAQDSQANLATALENKKNHLIASCTMKGPAHDALHLWLLPYMGHIEDLAKAQTEDQKNEALADLRQSFDTFHTYFE